MLKKMIFMILIFSTIVAAQEPFRIIDSEQIWKSPGNEKVVILWKVIQTKTLETGLMIVVGSGLNFKMMKSWENNKRFRLWISPEVRHLDATAGRILNWMKIKFRRLR